jgi:hypothetical protein
MKRILDLQKLAVDNRIDPVLMFSSSSCFGNSCKS